jgi:hypothetical protein
MAENLWLKDNALLLYNDALALADHCCCAGDGVLYNTMLCTDITGSVFSETTYPPNSFTRGQIFTLNGSPSGMDLPPTNGFLLIPAIADCSKYWVIGKKTSTGLTSAWYWDGISYVEKNTGLPDCLNTSLYKGFYDSDSQIQRMPGALYAGNQQPGLIFGTRYSWYGQVSDIQEWYFNIATDTWIQGAIYNFISPTIITSVTKQYKNGLWACTYDYYDAKMYLAGTGVIPVPNSFDLANQTVSSEVQNPLCHAIAFDNEELYAASAYLYYRALDGKRYCGSGIAKWNGAAWVKLCLSWERYYPGLFSDVWWRIENIDVKAGNWIAKGAWIIGGSNRSASLIAYNDFLTLYNCFTGGTENAAGAVICRNYIVTNAENNFTGSEVFDIAALSYIQSYPPGETVWNAEYGWLARPGGKSIICLHNIEKYVQAGYALDKEFSIETAKRALGKASEEAETLKQFDIKMMIDREIQQQKIDWEKLFKRLREK